MKADLNFFTSYKMTNKHLMMKSKVSYMITAMIIVVLALIAFITMFLVAINIKDGITLDGLRAEKAEYAQSVIESAQVTKELNKAKNKETAIVSLVSSIEMSRMLEKKEIDTVFTTLPADTGIMGISYSQSVMAITGISKDKHSPSLYAENLDKEELLVEVSYPGFTEKKDGDTVIGYEFITTCLFGGKQ